MYKIVIFTHDALAKGLLDTSRIVMGTQPDIETYSVSLGCDLEELKEKIKSSIAESQIQKQKVLVLTDLMYGTPFNIMAELQDKFDFFHITGANLPMLLEAINRRREQLSEETVKMIVETGKKGIFDCREFLTQL